MDQQRIALTATAVLQGLLRPCVLQTLSSQHLGSFLPPVSMILPLVFSYMLSGNIAHPYLVAKACCAGAQGLQREHPDLEDHPLLRHNATVFKDGQDALQV